MSILSIPISRTTGLKWITITLLAISALWILAHEQRTWQLAINTVMLAAATCAISLPLGTFLAILFTRSDLPGRSWWFVCYSSLLFVPLFLQCAGWRAGFGQQGFFTLVWDNPGLFPILNGWWGAVWIHAVSAVPWVTIIVGASLLLVEPELEEDSLLDTPAWHVIGRITLWRALPGVYASLLWIIVTTAGEITVTDLFMVRTLAEDLYLGYYLGETSIEAELGILPALALFFFTAIAAWNLCDYLVPTSWEPSQHNRLVIQLGTWRWLAVTTTLLLLLLIVGVPLLSLTYKAGMIVTQTEWGRVRSWSFVKLFQTVGLSSDLFAIRRWEHLDAFVWSAGISGLAASCSLLIATALAWLAPVNQRTKFLFVGTMIVCLALPGPLIGRGIIHTLNQPDLPMLTWFYDQTIFAPCLALIFRGTPWCALVMWHALRSIPATTLDSSVTEGASSWTRLVKIALPQRIPALVACWLIALALGMGDVGSVMLTVPPGVDLLSIRVFGLLHAGVEDEVAGICLISATLFMVTGWSIVRSLHILRPFS